MPASERDARCAAPAAGRDGVRAVPMSVLLASCAAARAVSTPPTAPTAAEPVPVRPADQERPADAA